MCHQQFLKNVFITSVLNGVIACSRSIRARALGVIYVLKCLACSRALLTSRAYVLGMLHKMTYVACFKKAKKTVAKLEIS